MLCSKIIELNSIPIVYLTEKTIGEKDTLRNYNELYRISNKNRLANTNSTFSEAV